VTWLRSARQNKNPLTVAGAARLKLRSDLYERAEYRSDPFTFCRFDAFIVFWLDRFWCGAERPWSTKLLSDGSNLPLKDWSTIIRTCDP
jgi:hypothetical protein